MDRACAVRPGFALTEGNAAAMAEICRRWRACHGDRAAARARLLDPPAPLDRLASLDALGTGAVDLPARRRLCDHGGWSVGLLEEAERSRRVAAVHRRVDHSRPQMAGLMRARRCLLRRWPGVVYGC
jgi:predicted ATPase